MPYTLPEVGKLKGIQNVPISPHCHDLVTIDQYLRDHKTVSLNPFGGRGNLWIGDIPQSLKMQDKTSLPFREGFFSAQRLIGTPLKWSRDNSKLRECFVFATDSTCGSSA
jgi:hypothetical protein